MRAGSEPAMSAPEAGAGISSKIMNLKFMKRHLSSQPAAAAAASQPPPAVPSPAPAPPCASGPADAPPARAGPVVLGEDSLEFDAASGPPAQPSLLGFRAGRRSYGGFNARLEVRLGVSAEGRRGRRDVYT